MLSLLWFHYSDGYGLLAIAEVVPGSLGQTNKYLQKSLYLYIGMKELASVRPLRKHTCTYAYTWLHVHMPG